MKARERFVKQLLGEPIDRGCLWEDRFWAETRQRWLSEGMAPDYDFGFDFLESDSWSMFPVDYGYHPAYEETVLECHEDKKIIQDQYGVQKVVHADGTGMPQFLRFPLESAGDWAELKERLASDLAGRIPSAEQGRLASEQEEVPVTIGQSHLCGLFSLIREMAGDQCYYLFYDEPDLVKDIVTFQTNRICRFIKEATARTKVDRLFIWEDMCYKTGPLISPAIFEEFFLPGYAKVVQTAKECAISLIDVDSDGNIEKLLPLWLESGVNCLHPFEVQAGMDVNQIRRKFGTGFAMRGGVDKRALAHSYQEIDREIERIRPAYEAGKYLPHMDHSVPPDVPFRNYCYYLEKLQMLLGM